MSLANKFTSKILRKVSTIVYSAHLSLLNFTSFASLIESAGPVVSLTTHGARLRQAHLTIESIARGKVKPSRLILWLDKKLSGADLTKALRRLEKRGLEIRYTKDYGPHTKYYPYIEGGAFRNLPLVTADDDILYPVFWLERLSIAHTNEPLIIHCYRARVITLDSRGILTDYATWSLCRSIDASYRNFGTGVSGIIYPSPFLEKLRIAGDGFLQCCPKADDIWLHVQALRAGFKVRQLSSHPEHFPVLEVTQSKSLQMHNLVAGGNDSQIQATYNSGDLKILSASS